MENIMDTGYYIMIMEKYFMNENFLMILKMVKEKNIMNKVN